MTRYVVFDVESIGLHGEGFAVGWVVINSQGGELDAGCYACDPVEARGTDEDRAWVAANVPTPQSGYQHLSPEDVRRSFWRKWYEWRERGAILVTDCGWPVEARFLAACVDDSPEDRTWTGPYPLHDVATARLAAGLDPLETVPRLPGEEPAHDPLADARQSARLWLEALGKL